ncbi:MAG: HlyD family efflux transporter periplasmic adaptor subunit [Tissierellia bacterium]|nr:HlyD family efflux transporter periplasmic adaptor subunit [Tissierellia bacterium]
MKKKKYIMAAVIIIPVFIIASLLIGGQQDQFKTSKVKLGNIKKTVEETGTVFSKRVNTFYSDISRRVQTLNVSVGDEVSKGDLILIYENNFDLEIERANKQIEAITASYNESIKGANFQEISNLKLNINTIETNLTFAKNNLEKIKTLYENNAVSQVEYDEAENAVTVLENQLEEANNNYSLLMQGVSSNVKRQYEAQIEEIMIQIQILEKNREQSSIKAEFDGVITELNVHEGSMTQPGVLVVEIQDSSNLGIYLEVLAEDAREILKGMAFNIVENNNIVKSLSVDRIHPKARSKVSDLGVEQKRVRIEADLDESYKLGTEVDVEIVLEEKEDVLLVDKDAIYEKDEKKYVDLVIANDPVEREVTIGIEDGNYVEVLAGLSENDLVIIE